MINAPNFAQTSDKGDMRTFAMGFPPDSRAINWHVDRYVRNQWRDNYFVSQYHGYNKEDLDPKKWGIVEPLWDEVALKYVKSLRGNHILVVAQKELYSHYCFKDPGTVRIHPYNIWNSCVVLGNDNLSLTRYDWQPNGVPKYYNMGKTDDGRKYFEYGHAIPTTKRIPLLMAISMEDFYSSRYEPKYLTKSECGQSFHGPSWEFWDWRKSL